MYSTVDDLFLWDQALYTDRLLTAQSKELMYKPALNNYAYGWFISKAKLGTGTETVPSINHGGGINGFNTLITRYPVQKNLVVLLDNTSQGENLDNLSQDLTNILYNQPYELPKMPLAAVLLKTIQDKGVDAGIAQYRDLKARQPTVFDFGEPELNTLGYRLLQGKKLKEAIEIFKLNVEAYPAGFNTYDSLGEAYLNNGDKELAVKNYKKSLELNPENTNAAATLKRLETPSAPAANGASAGAANGTSSTAAAVDPKTFDAYFGEYEVTPTFKAAVFKDGEKLMTQATDQPAFELVPESVDNFYIKAVDAKVTFTRDDKGVVTGLVIHQGGRDVPAKKIK
jgi:tetratricopeptide (TPR) repeat protein